MNTKRKSFIKTAVIALALLLTVALALGLSGAWYNASRRASGTITMTGGIIIDYSGFGQAQDGTWGKEEDDEISFLLFSEQENALPGASIALNNAGIKANDASVDFYARVKLTYKFYTDANGGQANDVTSSVTNYSDFISTPAFASAWVDSNNSDGYYYYATNTTLNAIPKEATLGNGNYVDIFADSQTISLAGNAAGFNHEGGGYQYNEDILIKRIEVYLTLETLQANQAAATANNWAISEPAAQYTDNAGVVYTQNPNSTWTLTDGTALNSDSSSTSASTLSATIYDNASYSYTILSTIDGQDVTAIGDEAFLNASQLTAVTIPTTVSTIGVRAFEGTGLNAITLTENVTSVGANALNTNSLSEVTIENEDSVITGIASAGIPTASTINVPSATLSGYETTLGASYTNLAAATPAASVGLAYEYDSENQTYTVTGIGTFSGTALVIPSTYDDGTHGEHDVTSINWSAFNYCTGLTSITIPSSITYMDGEPFIGCTGLTSFSSENSKYQVIDNGRCLVEVDGNQQTLIAFAPSGVSTYTIPSSITSIGVAAFGGRRSLTSIIIPDSVTRIEADAFSNCYSLTSVVMSNGLIYIGDHAFSSCYLTYITIPNGVRNIGMNAFSGCEGLTSITIPSSVTSIGGNAFNSTNLISIIVDINNTVYSSVDGVLYNKLQTELIRYPCGKTGSFTIPSSVTSIGDDAFSYCDSLTSITIPSSVTSIGGGAFSSCYGLTSITIPNSVTIINWHAFLYCYNLEEVIFEEGRTEDLIIRSDSFEGCTKLTNFELPEGAIEV